MAVTKRAGRAAKGAAATKQSTKPVVRKAVYETSRKKEVGVSDLTLLSKISNESINDNLRKRFEHQEIYTYIGHVLISVNPFRDLGIYTDAVLDSYRGRNRLEMSPHVFAIAESSFYNMKSYKDNQCIIISGESGAGKTEAAKRIMQYIANVSGGASSQIQEVKDMVLATNPLLESFGCAKTLRNNNSSRHGKYLEIQFNAQGEPVGANITNYLLEKNRVVGQILNERNFHIFYQFTKAAPQDYRDRFGVQPPEAYLYTSRSRCYNADGIDDHEDFASTLQAMTTIGLSQQEIDDIFRVLAAVLWLGNIQFLENNEGNAAIADESVPTYVAYLMDVDGASVNKALTSRIIEAQRGGRRGSVYDVPLNITQATAVRDALAKAIYDKLFDWIVQRVNASMRARGKINNTIGILDIYGFEIFDTNSFEQLCINYVNEKLQQIFIQLTLKTEQEEYAREQIKWTPINYFDNKVVCDLIEEKRPPGIFAALNDAVATAHADSGAADSSFTQRLSNLSSQYFELRQGQFLVKHYAGDVMYTVSGMTDKNKDQLLRDLLDLVAASSNPFMHAIFPERVDHDSKKRPPTAGDKIRASANDLVTTLMRAQPSYIRTIKPNSNKSPSEYDERAVLHQIKYLGLQENVRIRRAGFAYRQTFQKFVDRFYLLSSRTSYAAEFTWKGDIQSAVQVILQDTLIPKEEWQMGISKIFIKTPETLFALEAMRDKYWHTMATRIQRAWRRYLQKKIDAATKIQRLWRYKKDSGQYLELRNYGHRVLAGRKERRSYSVCGMRRFLGDYLGVNSTQGMAGEIRGAAQIGPGERVDFSCRIEVLVTKFGRSSKPSPRMLIITNKAAYFVISTLIGGQLNMSAERIISLGAIKYISMSSLRDDWVAFALGSTTEPDIFFSCVFKTELVTRLQIMLRGIDIRIGPTVDWAKKPGKLTTIKFVKDPRVPRDDVYKSSTVHVPEGLPPNSNSRPTPRSRPAASASSYGQPAYGQPAYGQPAYGQSSYGQPAYNQQNPTPATGRQAQRRQPNGFAQVVQESRTPTQVSVPQASRTQPPPPPPPPMLPPAPAQPAQPIYRAMYDFNGQTASELSFSKGEVLDITRKEGNGWWLAKRNSQEGWVPQNYLKEEMPAPAPKPAPPAPPPAPALRPVPAAPTGRISSGATQLSLTPNGPAAVSAPRPPVTNGRVTGAPPPPVANQATGRRVPPPAPSTRPTGNRASAANPPPPPAPKQTTSGGQARPNLAANLADMLKQRESKIRGQDDEEEEW